MVASEDFIETQILELPTRQIVVACSQRTAEEGLFAWSQRRFSSTRKVNVPNVWESTVHTRISNTFSWLHRMKGLKAEVQLETNKKTNKKAKLRLLKEDSLQRYLSFLVCLCNCQRAVTE